MKPKLKIFSIILAIGLLSQCKKEEFQVKISDRYFLKALINKGIDTDNDKQISRVEAEAVTSLNISGFGILDITGIELFTNLDTLICDHNSFPALDVSNNTGLFYLDCSYN